MELAVFDRQFVVGQTKIVFEPFEKDGVEDAAASVEGVAGEPDQFRSRNFSWRACSIW